MKTWLDCLAKAFYLDSRPYQYVIGAGGKTTLIDQLSRAGKFLGYPSWITTTTRILIPDEQPDHYLLINPDPVERIKQFIQNPKQRGLRLTFGKQVDDSGRKLLGLAPETVDAIRESFPQSLIFVEADGAAAKSFKTWRTGEPVLSSKASQTILVLSAEIVGKPLDGQWIHRIRLAKERLGKKHLDRLNAEHLVELLCYPESPLEMAIQNQPLILLVNQVNTAEQADFARELLKQLRSRLDSPWKIEGRMADLKRQWLEWL